MTEQANLIAKAESVVSLWNLTLFASGNADARQKRADVMHEAVSRLQDAITTVRGIAA